MRNMPFFMLHRGIVHENSKVIKLQDRVPKLKNQKKKNKKQKKIVNHRLILYISILFLLVLFLIYFRSPLSNIKKNKCTWKSLYDR